VNANGNANGNGPGDDHRDELPDELSVESAYVGEYQFPDVRRRRIAGTLYAIVAVLCAVGFATSSNEGLLFSAILLALVAAYHFLTAWPLAVDQTDALAVASREVGFPVGHASAQVTWRGLRSRPLWRVLVYSADEPPSFRGIVELDAVEGHVLYATSEQNPEDWSEFGVTTPKPSDE
jgi:hypothetical protein